MFSLEPENNTKDVLDSLSEENKNFIVELIKNSDSNKIKEAVDWLDDKVNCKLEQGYDNDDITTVIMLRIDSIGDNDFKVYVTPKASVFGKEESFYISPWSISFNRFEFSKQRNINGLRVRQLLVPVKPEPAPKPVELKEPVLSEFDELNIKLGIARQLNLNGQVEWITSRLAYLAKETEVEGKGYNVVDLDVFDDRHETSVESYDGFIPLESLRILKTFRCDYPTACVYVLVDDDDPVMVGVIGGEEDRKVVVLLSEW